MNNAERNKKQRNCDKNYYQSIIYLYQTNGPYQRRRKIDNKKVIKVIALNTA